MDRGNTHVGQTARLMLNPHEPQAGQNAAGENYKLFCATTTIATLPNFGERVRGLHQEMQRESDSVRAEFESCQSTIPRQVQHYEKKTKSKQRLITGLTIFAVIVFSATIVACVILAFCSPDLDDKQSGGWVYIL